ncbi:MAG: DUF1549 domain-containing protein [Planctomycetota bacterium]|nr:DUF1549 domain-containing protein [Planctomycetota bacterium]
MTLSLRTPVRLVLGSLLLLTLVNTHAAENVTIDIPGGAVRGRVLKLDANEVVIETTKGKQTIPASFLDAKALFQCKRALADLTNAEARFELGKYALDKGLPALAEKEFEEVAKLDMKVYKEKCFPLLPKLKETPAAPASGVSAGATTAAPAERAPNAVVASMMNVVAPQVHKPDEKPPTEVEVKGYWSNADFEILSPIDKYVMERLKADNLPPSPRCTDDEFIRRLYLDVLGVIPASEDVQVFVADPASDKRAQLVNKVLAHPRYADHWTVLWGDLLREHTDAPQEEGTIPRTYRNWIHGALAKNMPYDQFVAELLTATGRANLNGAVNFYLRDGRERIETVNTAATVFMGTRMACAQCHDHPFDVWEQSDFHSLMAFFGPRTHVERDDLSTVSRVKDGMGDDYYKNVAAMVKKYSEEADKKLAELAKARAEELKKNKAADDKLAYGEKPPAGGDIIKRMMDEVEKAGGKDTSERLGQLLGRYRVNWVYESDSGEYSMPSEVGGGRANAVFPWEKEKKFDGKGSRREALAGFLAGSRQFAEVQANRLWAHLFGRGLVHPVDDFRRKNPPSHPEVLALLADELVKAKFDNKAVLRLILNSNTYQRSSMPNKSNKADEELFSHRRLRRMSAEQIYDSILVASGQKPAPKVLTPPQGARVAELPAKGGGTWAYEVATPARSGTFLHAFNQSDREQLMVERDSNVSITQALELFNGGSINDAARLDKSGYAVEQLTSGKFNGADIVNLLYLRTLSRYPTQTEMGIARGYIGSGSKPQVEDLLWALMNTREFMFIK